jgi:hypothetical protein
MAEVIFTGLVQGQHNYHFSNQDEDVMVAIIDLVYKGQSFRIEVKQPYGTNFEEDEGFELYVPFDSLLRELNYSVLSDKCEEYYRSTIGSNGNGIRIEGGSNIRMSNNTFVQQRLVDIPLANDNGTTW